MRVTNLAIAALTILASGCAASTAGPAGDTVPTGSIPASGIAEVVSPAGKRVVSYRLDGNRVLTGSDEYIGDIGRNVSKTLREAATRAG